MVTLAVFLCGGTDQYIDTEYIAKKTDEIFPEKFRWRKYRDQIDLNHIMISLREAKLDYDSRGALVLGSVTKGWTLTGAGLTSAKTNLSRIGIVTQPKPKVDSRTEKWAKRQTPRLRAEHAFELFTQGKIDLVTAQDATKFFGLDNYIQGDRRTDRIQRYLKTFSDEETLGPAVRAISEKITNGKDVKND